MRYHTTPHTAYTDQPQAWKTRHTTRQDTMSAIGDGTGDNLFFLQMLFFLFFFISALSFALFFLFSFARGLGNCYTRGRVANMDDMCPYGVVISFVICDFRLIELQQGLLSVMDRMSLLVRVQMESDLARSLGNLSQYLKSNALSFLLTFSIPVVSSMYL